MSEQEESSLTQWELARNIARRQILIEQTERVGITPDSGFLARQNSDLERLTNEGRALLAAAEMVELKLFVRAGALRESLLGQYREAVGLYNGIRGGFLTLGDESFDDQFELSDDAEHFNKLLAIMEKLSREEVEVIRDVLEDCLSDLVPRELPEAPSLDEPAVIVDGRLN